MKKKANKSKSEYSKLSAKMNLNYSIVVSDITNSDDIDYNSIVEELLDMIDNRINLDNAANLSKNQKSTQIILENSAEVIQNKPSQVWSHQVVPFCDHFVEDWDQIWGSVFEKSDEDISLLPSGIFDDNESTCRLFCQKTNWNEWKLESWTIK